MFAASLHRIVRRPYSLLGALVLVAPLFAPLFAPSPASAQSDEPELQLSNYALSFGPETQRSAEGRWDRDYLAQIRFGTTPRSKADPARGGRAGEHRFVEHSDRSRQAALRQVIALESELWKRHTPGATIADNRFATLPPRTPKPHAQELAYGPQPLDLPFALADPREETVQLSECELQTAPAVTIAQSRATERTHSEMSTIQVTPRQDRTPEPC